MDRYTVKFSLQIHQYSMLGRVTIASDSYPVCISHLTLDPRLFFKLYIQVYLLKMYELSCLSVLISIINKNRTNPIIAEKKIYI